VSCRLKAILSDEIVTKLVKFFDPKVAKRVKLLKLLKYMERMFQLETWTYFSSIEIKVINK
jgi:hypothetical protein